MGSWWAVGEVKWRACHETDGRILLCPAVKATPSPVILPCPFVVGAWWAVGAGAVGELARPSQQRFPWHAEP